MSTPSPGPVDAPHTPPISVTAEVLYAVRTFSFGSQDDRTLLVLKATDGEA